MDCNNSTEISNNELQLCPGCQTFFGRKETNFMCSKCFKETQVEITMETEENTSIPSPESAEKASEEPKIASTKPSTKIDVEMKDEVKVETEEKKISETIAPKPKVSIHSTAFVALFPIVHH